MQSPADDAPPTKASIEPMWDQMCAGVAIEPAESATKPSSPPEADTIAAGSEVEDGHDAAAKKAAKDAVSTTRKAADEIMAKDAKIVLGVDPCEAAVEEFRRVLCWIEEHAISVEVING